MNARLRRRISELWMRRNKRRGGKLLESTRHTRRTKIRHLIDAVRFNESGADEEFEDTGRDNWKIDGCGY